MFRLFFMKNSKKTWHAPVLQRKLSSAAYAR